MFPSSSCFSFETSSTTSPLSTVELFHLGSSRVEDTTYLGRLLSLSTHAPLRDAHRAACTGVSRSSTWSVGASRSENHSGFRATCSPTRCRCRALQFRCRLRADCPVLPARLSREGVTVSCSAGLAGHYHLRVARPVPENTFSRTTREQRAHLAGEVFKTITKQVRRRGREGQVTRQDALAISQQIGDARNEELPGDTEASPRQHILETVSSLPGGALAGAARRSEISRYQRLDLIVGDRRHPRIWRQGPARHRMNDQCERADRLRYVVDGLGHLLLVGPVELLAEGHQLARHRCDSGKVLGQALDPPDVHDSLFPGGTAALRKHAGVRVQADRLLK